MKKLVTYIFAACALCALLTGAALAADTVASGTCGSNLTWTLDSDGVLTISGSGDMAGYSEDSLPLWSDCVNKITSVEIRSGVTSIGKYAFYGCANLESITIPSSVTNIGEYVFDGCSSLTKRYIADLTS